MAVAVPVHRLCVQANQHARQNPARTAAGLEFHVRAVDGDRRETRRKLAGRYCQATHLNHQTILAVGQRRIHDKRLRNGPGPPPRVTPPKRRRTDAPPEPVDDDDRTEDYAGPPVDVSAEELDAAKAKAAALHAAAALADADLATKKRQRRETIEREIERLQAARDALESDAE